MQWYIVPFVRLSHPIPMSVPNHIRDERTAKPEIFRHSGRVARLSIKHPRDIYSFILQFVVANIPSTSSDYEITSSRCLGIDHQRGICRIHHNEHSRHRIEDRKGGWRNVQGCPVCQGFCRDHHTGHRNQRGTGASCRTWLPHIHLARRKSKW
jgi:hypothetical protein